MRVLLAQHIEDKIVLKMLKGSLRLMAPLNNLIEQSCLDDVLIRQVFSKLAAT